MKPRIFLTSALVAALFAGANAQQAVSFKFDFGPGKAAPGYVQVLPEAVYSATAGFGFDFGTRPSGLTRKGSNPLKSDLVRSTTPFYFSVNVPEGNYEVRVTLGDPEGTSYSTVKAESRRLMLENVRTFRGKFITKTFIVYVKDRKISTGGQVALKERELTKLDWDDKLTLEFDQETALSSLEISKVDDQVTVFLAGNSTVVNQEEEPWASWGQMITRFFEPGVAIANQAESGLSLGSFIGQKRLDKVLSVMKAGDFVFVEFGHNDEKEKGANDGPYKSYSDRLRLFADKVKEKGGTLVIVTPTARRSFSGNTMVNTHGDYPDAARKVAVEKGVALIDLTALSTQLFEAMGPEGSKNAFVIYPEKNMNDNTHFNPYGAYELAKIIVEGIKANKLSLAKYLVKRPAFDPRHPDAFAEFKWPESPKVSLVKPDGN
ncbi:rhamnogalacturonan acetylesterase [Hufsiella ginkgonis]|uniref:Rhamnogalacturonan acetylesterase n=1 Tax=Hufsiella ginkgonis TaxID=2695274 RepID=A0A7K1Y258_9SPHI|nr:rhamnogalacturonan acetylesterase [Hufsiella ginkgonis]MXV17350.1 rhamnogalacturonan acetylesterase [Hufsiella ginkgonis]